MTNQVMSLAKDAKSGLRRIIYRGYANLSARNDVVVSGWEASGSTFIYQACKLLGVPVRKSHKLPRARFGYTLFAFRNPRDIVTSNARRMQAELWESDPESALLLECQRFAEREYPEEILQAKGRANVHLIRYELFFNGNEKSLISLIADQFSLRINCREIDRIYDSISLDANQARASSLKSFDKWDKDWQIHGNHITNRGKSGAWQEHFTEKVKEYFRQNFGDLLVDLHYTSDQEW